MWILALFLIVFESVGYVVFNTINKAKMTLKQ